MRERASMTCLAQDHVQRIGEAAPRRTLGARARGPGTAHTWRRGATSGPAAASTSSGVPGGSPNPASDAMASRHRVHRSAEIVPVDRRRPPRSRLRTTMCPRPCGRKRSALRQLHFDLNTLQARHREGAFVTHRDRSYALDQCAKANGSNATSARVGCSPSSPVPSRSATSRRYSRLGSPPPT